MARIFTVDEQYKLGREAHNEAARGEMVNWEARSNDYGAIVRIELDVVFCADDIAEILANREEGQH